jgi:predicted nucleotide-binding protein
MAKAKANAKGDAKVEAKAASLQGKIKSDFPKHTLEEALRIAQGIEDKNGGGPMPPIEMASAIDTSPGSSEFRVVLSSSIKYGLTSGSFNAGRISLEEQGRNIVEASSDESRRNALVQAALTPPTFKSMYQHFKGKKLPEATFFENTIVREFDVPREHAKKCVEIFTKNAEYIGVVRTLPSGKWLSTAPIGAPEDVADAEAEADAGVQTKSPAPAAMPAMAGQKAAAAAAATGKPKVFIAHGKNAQVVIQLKDVLTFGNFEPVVAEEYETAAKSIPDKVLALMRGCSAGIIHVAGEEELLDKSGATHHKLNENVLIEIGAAMALYGRKFILLVQKGLHMPSNLQGLYLCYYEGDKLDYEATMKLLKAFAEFRTG